MKQLPLKIGVLAAFAGLGGLAVYAKHISDSTLYQPIMARIHLPDETDGRDAIASNNGGGGRQSGGTLVSTDDKTPGVFAPSKDQSRTAIVTAQLLAYQHFLRNASHDDISNRLWKLYLDALDPRHLYFLESDVQEFEKYRPQLDDMLIKKGDTTPAFELFTRLLKRADQHVAYANSLLASEKFSFDTDEDYNLDRKNSPRPKTIKDAEKEWKNYLRYEYLQEKLSKTKPDELVKNLQKRYSRLSRTLHEYDKDDVFQLYLDALTHAYDPHSDYLGKSAYATFNMQMKLSLFGIGALLQSDDGYCKIAELTPGGPAIRSGLLKAGDRIVKVKQEAKEPVDVVDMKLDKIVEMIRGPKGTKVTLTVIPADSADSSARKELTLVRDEVKLEESEAKAKVVDFPLGNGATMRLGVIELPSFYADFDATGAGKKSATSDVAKLLKKLIAEKVKGVVLDLRNNPGGSLTEVVNMTGLFIKNGPVVQVRSSDGKVHVDNDDDSALLYDGPLVVMTNKFSASASEILAAALQDYGRALIVGDTSTFGKGTVQTVIPLRDVMNQNSIEMASEPGALKMTIQKFYRINGVSTQLKGVVPDIILPSITNYFDTGEGTLSNPLACDAIKASAFTSVNLVAPALPELKKRSDARMAGDQDFVYTKGEIERFKKMMALKSVSLNEKKRNEEKKENEDRVAKRKKELLARGEGKEKVYLITLANVANPGLTLAPPPKPDKKAKPVDSAADPTTPDEPPIPIIDFNLNETERILMDMISLRPQANGSTSVRR